MNHRTQWQSCFYSENRAYHYLNAWPTNYDGTISDLQEKSTHTTKYKSPSAHFMNTLISFSSFPPGSLAKPRYGFSKSWQDCRRNVEAQFRLPIVTIDSSNPARGERSMRTTLGFSRSLFWFRGTFVVMMVDFKFQNHGRQRASAAWAAKG